MKISELLEKITTIDSEHKERIIDVCLEYYKRIDSDFTEFLNHCVCCGGDWNGMLYSGIKECLPRLYDVLPNNGLCDNGIENFVILSNLINLCGYKSI